RIEGGEAGSGTLDARACNQVPLPLPPPSSLSLPLRRSLAHHGRGLALRAALPIEPRAAPDRVHAGPQSSAHLRGAVGSLLPLRTCCTSRGREQRVERAQAQAQAQAQARQALLVRHDEYAAAVIGEEREPCGPSGVAARPPSLTPSLTPCATC